MAVDSDVHVLLVLAPEPGSFGFRPRERSETGEQPAYVRAAAAAVLASMTSTLEASGVAATSLLASGPTIETIIDRADAIDALAIVIIDRRHGLGHRLLMGSVGQSLLEHTHRPVLVVPAAASGDVDTGLLAHALAGTVGDGRVL